MRRIFGAAIHSRGPHVLVALVLAVSGGVGVTAAGAVPPVRFVQPLARPTNPWCTIVEFPGSTRCHTPIPSPAKAAKPIAVPDTGGAEATR